MECVFELDRKNMIFRVTLEGRVTDSELKDCYEATRDYAVKTESRSAILDLSRVGLAEVSSGTLREIANSPPILGDPALRIIVAPSDYLFGLARMFQTIGEKTRLGVHVVRSLDQAYALLGATSPEFERLQFDDERTA
jgi:hypothetical protein